MGTMKETTCCKEVGYRALHHQHVGFEHAAKEFEQSARYQQQIAIADATAQKQSTMVSERLKIQHVAARNETVKFHTKQKHSQHEEQTSQLRSEVCLVFQQNEVDRSKGWKQPRLQ